MRGSTPSRTLLLVKTGWPVNMRGLAYRTFARLGWRVVVADQLVNQGLRVADVPVVCDLWDTDAACAEIEARAGVPDGILTFNDSALVQASLMAEQFNLPFFDVETARQAIDKADQRKILSEADLSVPKWKTLRGSDDLAACVEEWSAAVVKPVDRAAGAGVRLVRSADGAVDAFAEAYAESWSGNVLAEEYVTGAEVSVESVATGSGHRAVCVTDKTIHGEDRFIEVGHAVPSGMDSDALHVAVSSATRACDAVGLRNGVCHTEIKLSDEGPVVIEVNPRLAGDCIVDLIDQALDLNLYEVAGRLAMGEEVSDLLEASRANDKAAAIYFLLNPGGVFVGASSPTLGNPTPDWLVELSVTATPGTESPAPVSNAGRIAYAMAEGADSAQALARAREAAESVRLEFRAREREKK